MKTKVWRILHFTLLTILAVVAAVFAFMPHGDGVVDVEELVDKQSLENLLQEKYLYITEKSEVALKIASTKSDSVNVEFFDSLAGDFSEKGIGFFHYERGRLQHWSTT